MSPSDPIGDGIKATVLPECGVPDERTSLELESGDPVAEVLDGGRGGGADEGTDVPESTAGRERQGGEILTHLSRGQF